MPSPAAPRRPLLQFPLRVLLVAVLLLGPLLGFGLPMLVRLVRDLTAPPPAPPATVLPVGAYESKAGYYYESAETPLD